MPGVLERGAVERPGGPQRHRRGERDQDPLPSGEPVAGEQRQRDGQVAERDEEDQRQDQPAAQVGGLVVGGLRLCPGRWRRARSGRPRTPRPRPPRSSPAPGRPPARSTVACSVAKLTAATTPGPILVSFFSTRAAHAAQVMPLIDSSTVRAAAAPSTADGADTSSIGPPGCRSPVIEPEAHVGAELPGLTRRNPRTIFAGHAAIEKAHPQTTSGDTIRVVINGSSRTLMSHAPAAGAASHDSRQQLR